VPANGTTEPLITPVGTASTALVYTHSGTLTALGGPFTATASAVRVIRLGAGGAFDWSVSADGANNERALGVATTSPGIAVVGSYNSASVTLDSVNDADELIPGVAGDTDGFVWAIDNDGDYQWHVRISGAGTTDASLVASDGTNVYVAGRFSGSTLVVGTSGNLAGSLTTGIYVAKLLPNGARAWVTVLSGDSTYCGSPSRSPLPFPAWQAPLSGLQAGSATTPINLKLARLTSWRGIPLPEDECLSGSSLERERWFSTIAVCEWERGSTTNKAASSSIHRRAGWKAPTID
jgi:hypothetical protein